MNKIIMYKSLLKSYNLCVKRDDFIWDKVVWIATLDHDIEVWQDDGREGLEEPNAWIRLKNYIEENNDYIRKFELKFRSHMISLPKSKAYYFTKGILGSTAMKNNIHYANAGFLRDDNKIEVSWYKIPELLVTKTVIKEMSEINGPELIQGQFNA